MCGDAHQPFAAAVEGRENPLTMRVDGPWVAEHGVEMEERLQTTLQERGVCHLQAVNTGETVVSLQAAGIQLDLNGRRYT